MASRIASDDEYDALSDDFGDIDLDNVPALSAPTVPPSSLPVQDSSVPEDTSEEDGSSEYGFDDDLDMNTLDALDALEQSLAGPSSSQAVENTTNTADVTSTGQTPAQNGPGPHLVNSRFTPGPLSKSQPNKAPAPAPPLKRSATVAAEAPPPKRARGEDGSFKTRLRGVLDKFEDELTCPICFDIFALAHYSPCGHSACGDCLAEWIDKAKTPTCPSCREVIDANAPLVPNITLNSMLEKHVSALRDSGAEDWASGGPKFIEWTARKEYVRSPHASRSFRAQLLRRVAPYSIPLSLACRANMAKRRATKPTVKKAKAVQREETELTVGGDDPEDEDYEGSDNSGSDGERALVGSARPHLDRPRVREMDSEGAGEVEGVGADGDGGGDDH
ncbi:hypothetical protein PENSPDRAFT_679125 [Peniophora sp. CONT]|nr:hypothetical protein PENSPDRAFT_679125 [Peniophora sp. CONT]